MGFVSRSFYRGKALRVAALPGLGYLNHAVRTKDYDLNTYKLRDYDPPLQRFLRFPARMAETKQVAQSNLDSSEITRTTLRAAVFSLL